MKYYDINQNSEEWFDMRSGRITSSAVAKVMANFGKAFGEPAKAYAAHIALERFNGKKIEKDYYTSSVMERGTELEPVARNEYEINEMVEVKNGGFFEKDTLGDSPDGLVGENGVIEIKCVIPSTHFKTLKKGGYPSSYKWQIHFHMLVTGRDWCDFISYCPDFPEAKQLYVFRVDKDTELQKQMLERIAEFELLIEENINLLKNDIQ